MTSHNIDDLRAEYESATELFEDMISQHKIDDGNVADAEKELDDINQKISDIAEYQKELVEKIQELNEQMKESQSDARSLLTDKYRTSRKIDSLKMDNRIKQQKLISEDKAIREAHDTMVNAKRNLASAYRSEADKVEGKKGTFIGDPIAGSIIDAFREAIIEAFPETRSK